jgi:membrane-bound lytic murein transglycosylase D
MWQFIPSTGRHYELTQNVFRNDRRDVLASTRAALDYLGYLHGLFNDWRLALAAYNWGEGNVQRALARNGRVGLPEDYQSLRMPAETRNYVPKLQAVKNIVAAPERFQLVLPALENHPYFLGVPIERDIDVMLAAHLAHMSVEEFKFLNPQMNKPVILAAGTPQVLLPYDNANAFVRNVEKHQGPLATWTAWVTPKTLRPTDAAEQVGMSEADLREVNQIPPRMLIRAGSTLLVPRDKRRGSDVSPHLAENGSMDLAPERPALRRLVVKADSKGVTVAAIARRYGTTASEVARWNKVAPGARFAPGAAVVVYVQPAARTRAAAPQRKATTASNRTDAAGSTRKTAAAASR